MIRLVSGGIMLSNDGGFTWRTGITAGGINADYLKSGLINTEEIMIGNGRTTSFRWDKDGINAYKVSFDNNGNAIGFNDAVAVRYDQYGIYGINGITNFIPRDENYIWEKASFALTWKGFQLKNNYGNGYVAISSTEDFVVKDGEISRIKIGNLGTSEKPVYGIRISDNQNIPVMETDDSGELWLRKHLRVGTELTSKVEIGYLSNFRIEQNKEYHQVIRAGDVSKETDEAPFVVYEDGKVIAKNIEVRGGKIGNMTIAELEGGDRYEVQIISVTGTNIRQNSSVTLIAKLYSGSNEITEFTCQWLDQDGLIIADDNDKVDVSDDTKSITIKGINFGSDGYIRYGCRAILPDK